VNIHKPRRDNCPIGVNLLAAMAADVTGLYDQAVNNGYVCRSFGTACPVDYGATSYD
jgi:hypothetical protein